MNKESNQRFDKVFNQMKRKPGGKYDFLTKGGHSLKMALYNLYKTVWKSEEIPESWYESSLTQLFKSGSIDDLNNMRFIHEKKDLVKLLGQLVISYVKEIIFDNMPKFQIACRPGHRASEHLFVMKSVIALYERKRKGIIICSYDFHKFFDSENIFDCFFELHKSKIRGKLYRLLFQMNKKIKIKVKTPVGETEEKEAGPTLAQGSVDAAILSSNSIANGVEEAFDDSEKEMMYKELEIHPLSFMDDVERMADNIESAQEGNQRMEKLVEEKLLSFNMKKSNYILIGSKNARTTIQKELEKNPLILCGKEMKETKALKYLGDFWSYDLADSVHQTVLRRLGFAKQAIYEIRAIVEDTRASKIGGINIAFTIWDAAIIPMILHNAEMFTNMRKKTLNLLKNLFNEFYRAIFRISSGCPQVGYYWEVGALEVDQIIIQKKLMFYHHLANLPLQSVAREVFDIQEADSDSFPGLVKELEPYLIKLGNPDPKTYTKYQWKRKTKYFVREQNRNQLLEKMKKYKKLDYEKCKDEKFERKDYFYSSNLEDTRVRFRISNKMVKNVRKNFPGMYTNQSLTCPSCRREDIDTSVTPVHSQSHLIKECIAFQDLREQLDLETDEGLCEFFKTVMTRLSEEGE